MVAEQRRALLDPSAPTPSIETLLHAFLPAKFVDHSHADAILALTNQPDGEARVRALFGDRVGWVPYTMPGFALAKRAAEVFEKDPTVEGLVLEKHGFFTFGDDAKTSYERHVALVGRADAFFAETMGDRRPLDARPVVAMREWKEIASVVRGALAVRTGDLDQPYRRFVLEHRSSDLILHFAAAPQGPELAATPPITPDHVIRTKGPYLFLERPPYGSYDALAARLREEIETYRVEYAKYFDRNVAAKGVQRVMLDPTPRVLVLPGIGLVAVGESRRAARIAADVAEHTVRVKVWAASIGQYEGISEGDLFDMEYWSLEQAKLGKSVERPLERQVVLVTGGAGAIGRGIADACAAAGAHVVLVDLDARAADAAAEELTQRHGAGSGLGLGADVTDEASLRAAFDATCVAYGGVDVVVPNAGVGLVKPIAELSAEEVRRVSDVNYVGVLLTVREAARVFRAQGTGGNIVINASKNVFAPGRDFAAYSASKAAAHQLGKVAALELAELGVRVNQVNADAVFGHGETASGLWREVGPARARSRGLAPEALPEFYRERNLLRARIEARHVGNAVVFFASQATPTTGATLPVDGGVPEAFPR
jgi:rhamnulose-1-phosphate aldolase/alcohol dehydrogenase